MKNKTYNKNRIATAITCALMPIMLSSVAIADESLAKKAKKEKEDMEIIEVKSFKDSVASSLNNKRGANSIIDAINADDVGNFPDSNVAESLQRLPGISIERSLDGSGEGVSIRGFGSGKNLALVNGQQWTSSAFNLENGLGRGNNFGLLPSTIISRLEVYKSPEARLQEGGVGGVVNVVTHKPLSQKDEFFAKVSAKAKYNTVSEDTAPDLSGIVSWKLDDKFGALVSVDYSDITTRRESIEVLRYDKKTFTPVDTGVEMKDVWVPGAIGSANFNQTRERKTAMVSLQYRPTDSIDMNLNYLTSDMSGDNLNTNLISMNHAGFFNQHYKNNGILSATLDEKTNTVTSITYAPFTNPAHRAGQLGAIHREADITSDMVQFDASWLGDNLSLKVGAGLAKSSGGAGHINSFVTMVQGRSTNSIDDGVGYVKYLDADPSTFGVADGQVLAHGRAIIESNNENTYLSFDGEYFLDDGIITSIQFGLKQSDGFQDRFQTGFSNDFHQDRKDDEGNIIRPKYRFMDPSEFGDFISTPDNFLDGVTDNAITSYQYIHPLAVKDLDIEYTAKPHLGNSWKVEETIKSAYIQANYEIDFDSFILRGNAGLRYSDQEATIFNFYADGAKLDPSEELYLSSEDIENFNFNYVRTGTSDELLPSLNVIFDLENDWVFRAAYSSVISRPDYGQLAKVLSLSEKKDDDSDADAVIRKGSRGNHALESFRSDKLDFSAEWYYKDASNVSLALFYYDIQTFVSNEVNKETFFGEEYDISTLVNVDGGTIKGAELSISHVFDELPAPFDGLGTQLNYTFIDSNTKELHPVTEKPLPLAGLSENTYNAVIYYSKDKWDARVSYTYRDDFFERPFNDGARYNAGSSRVSAQIKYKFSKKFSAFIQGTNLTNDLGKRYIDIPERPWQTSQFGRNYSVGINYKF